MSIWGRSKMYSYKINLINFKLQNESHNDALYYKFELMNLSIALKCVRSKKKKKDTLHKSFIKV